MPVACQAALPVTNRHLKAFAFPDLASEPESGPSQRASGNEVEAIMAARIVAVLRRMRLGADPLGPHTHPSSGSHPAHHPLASGPFGCR